MKIAVATVFIAGMAFGQQPNPQIEPYSPGQVCADAVRDAAKADIAFIAAGHLRANYKAEDLTSLLQYPTDEIVVLKLTGIQVRQALERSVALLPQPNPSFLQISGLEVTISKGAAVGHRVVSTSVSGVGLDPTKEYRVAMPSSLGKGSLGYFKVWDKSHIAETLTGLTVEKSLQGKAITPTEPRWRFVQ